MSWLSQAKNFIFDNLKAAAARASASSSPTGQTMGQAATAAIATVATDIGAGMTSHQSAVGIANKAVGDLETAIKAAVDTYIEAQLGALPVVGGFLAKEAVPLANGVLDFSVQHAMNYVAALFANHSAAVNASAPQEG